MRAVSGRLAAAAGVLNLVLAAALARLAFGSLPETVGRPTGLWHPCLPGPYGHGRAGWSPLLLAVVAVPVALGALVAWRSPQGQARALAAVAAGMLAAVGMAMVAIPTGLCVS